MIAVNLHKFQKLYAFSMVKTSDELQLQASHVHSFLFSKGKKSPVSWGSNSKSLSSFHSCKANSFSTAAKIACLSHKRAINCQNEEI